MIHLQKISTEEIFEVNKSLMPQPWVTLTMDDKLVHYSSNEVLCPYIFSNGHTRDNVEVGDIVYYNDTAIGIVVLTPDMMEDGNGRMMALPVMSQRTPHNGRYNAYVTKNTEGDLQWGLYNSDVPEVGAYYKTEANVDYDGKGNTAKIVAMHTIDDLSTTTTISNGNDTNSAPAAACCYCYYTDGTEMGDWYLPSAGEWHKVSNYRQAINYSIADLNDGLAMDGSCDLVAVPLGDNSYETGDSRNNWGGNFGQWYWTSTEHTVITHAFYFNMYSLDTGLGAKAKNDANKWGCVRAFCHF